MTDAAKPNISMIRSWPPDKLADEVVKLRGQLSRVTALADELKASGIVSVYESALELGEMIEEAVNG